MSLNPESTETFAGIVSTSAEFDAGPSKLETVADSVQEALRGLQFGEITITVRNGAVVQIERIARKRQFKSKPSR